MSEKKSWLFKTCKEGTGKAERMFFQSILLSSKVIKLISKNTYKAHKKQSLCSVVPNDKTVLS